MEGYFFCQHFILKKPNTLEYAQVLVVTWAKPNFVTALLCPPYEWVTLSFPWRGGWKASGRKLRNYWYEMWCTTNLHLEWEKKLKQGNTFEVRPQLEIFHSCLKSKYFTRKCKCSNSPWSIRIIPMFTLPAPFIYPIHTLLISHKFWFLEEKKYIY